LNRRTLRKVASFVVPNMLPYLFTEKAIAACWWFKNDRGGPAFLTWEANGPGQEFQKRGPETDFGKGLLLPQARGRGHQAGDEQARLLDAEAFGAAGPERMMPVLFARGSVGDR